MTLRTLAYGTLPLVITLFGVFACDDGKKFDVVKSTNISVDPIALVFSPEPIGRQSIAAPVVVRQDGEIDLSVTKIFLQSDEFGGANQCDRVSLELGRNDPLPTELDEGCHFIIEERGGGQALPWTLGNNESLVVNITYRSLGTTPGHWNLVIESNAINGTKTIPLRVRAEQPIFGGTEFISFPISGGREFGVIRNQGTGLLNVESMRVEYLTEQPIDPETQEPIDEFRVRAGAELPWNLDNQTTQTITVEYNPVDEEADTAEIVFTSNNAQGAEHRVRLTSEAVQSVIDVQPSPAIFGQPTLPERTKRVELVIANRGLKSFDVNSLLIDQPGDDYSLINAPSSFQLHGGQTLAITVEYEPHSQEGTDATLLITSTADVGADDQRLTHVPLVRSGEQLPAVLNIEPPAVTMNEVAAGSSATQSVVLSNPGAQPLEISSITLSEGDGELPPSDPEFSITSGGGAVTIAPGGDHTVVVELSRPADDRRALFALLLIESNAPPSPARVYFTSSPAAQ